MLVYELSGLTIASEIALAARPAVDPGSLTAVDLRITLEEPQDQPYQRPSEDVIAEHGVDGFTWYSICRVGTHYVIRMPGIADFEIDADLTTISCRPTFAARAQVMPIVLTGTVMAFILTMRGMSVLHGSAVELDGRALAFVGVSGQGKSTLAAILCAGGARLVTDDVLPVIVDDDAHAVRCIRSGHEIRLREKSVSLTQWFDEGTEVRVTKDERHAVAPSFSESGTLELGAIAIPRPIHDAAEVTTRRLAPPEAMLALSRFDRIEGWRDRGHLSSMFDMVSRVVGIVPVYELTVPWGPPFAPGLAEDIARVCAMCSETSPAT